MKKLFILPMIFLVLFAQGQDKIETKYVEPEYSKALQKIKKKTINQTLNGTNNNKRLYIDLGLYWNEDSTKIYNGIAYKDKKSEEVSIDILTFNTEGEQLETETFGLKDKELKDHEFTKAQPTSDHSTDGGDISELYAMKVAYFKSTMLAGAPTLYKATFTPQYYEDTDVFDTYDIQETSNIKLEDRFWLSIAKPLNSAELGISKQNYLIDQGKNKWQEAGKIIRDEMTSEYLPVASTALVGGPMATMEMTKFLIGTMDLSNGNWISKNVIECDDKISGRKHNSVTLDNNNTAIQLTTRDGIIMLTVDDEGKEVSQAPIHFETNTGKNMGINSAILEKVDGGYMNVVAMNKATFGMPYLGISKTIDGNEPFKKVYDLKELGSNAITPANTKIKTSKIKNFGLERILRMNDDYIIEGIVSIQETAYNSLLHITTDGDIKAFYIFPKPIPLFKKEPLKVKSYRPLVYKKIDNNNYFITAGAEIDGLGRGISSYTQEYTNWGLTNTTYTYRIDYDRTYVGVLKINFKEKTLSNMETTESMVLGEEPGVVFDDGKLYLENNEGFTIVK